MNTAALEARVADACSLRPRSNRTRRPHQPQFRSPKDSRYGWMRNGGSRHLAVVHRRARAAAVPAIGGTAPLSRTSWMVKANRPGTDCLGSCRLG